MKSKHVLSSILLFLLILTGLFTRFWQLEQVPTYLYLDELDHVFVGEAIARWGTDITGTWTPWQLRSAPAPNVLAELPAVFYAAVQRMFGYGLGNAHLVSAIAGILSTIFTSIIVWLLFKSKRTALITIAFVLSTPLLVYVSRMAYEATLSTAFQLLYILGGVLFVYFAKSSKVTSFAGILLMFIALPLAYYTYHGAKALLPFLTLIFFAYLVAMIKSLKLGKVWYVLPLILVLTQILLLVQTFSLKSADVARRIDTQMIFSQGTLSRQVDEERRMSLDYPLKELVVNKPFVLLRNFFAGYLVAYDLRRLFVTGYEGGFQFSLIVYSFLYISSVPLLVLGTMYLWSNKKRRNVQLLVTLILIAPVTTALSGGGQSIFRSQLLYYLLVIVMALGFSYLEDKSVDRNKLTTWFPLVILSALCIEAAFFTLQYFGRYPVASAQNHYFNEELLTSYVNRVEKPATVVLSHPPYSEARSLISSLGLMPSLSIEQRRQFVDSGLKIYDLGQVILTSECISLQADQTIIVDSMQLDKCSYIKQVATISAQITYSDDKQKIILPTISAPSDSGAYYHIINDKLCSIENLPRYIQPTKLFQFNPAALTNEEFCNTWVKPEGFTL